MSQIKRFVLLASFLSLIIAITIVRIHFDNIYPSDMFKMFGSSTAKNSTWANASSIYDFTVKNLDNIEVNLNKYKGRVLLVVNVASKCGLTKTNYNELNEIYSKYHEKGLDILAFPCNQFGGQEPGCDVDIKAFMKAHKVEFDVFAKINVNGDDADPLYQWLKSKTPTGLLDKLTGSWIKWNFTKFLINKDGQPIDRFGPQANPLSFEKKIEEELEK